MTIRRFIVYIVYFVVFSILASIVTAEVPGHNPDLDSQCPSGFQWSKETASCKQAECPSGAGRTYTLDCNCGEAWDKPFKTCYLNGLATSCIDASSKCPYEKTSENKKTESNEIDKVWRCTGSQDCPASTPHMCNTVKNLGNVCSYYTGNGETCVLTEDGTVCRVTFKEKKQNVEVNESQPPSNENNGLSISETEGDDIEVIRSDGTTEQVRFGFKLKESDRVRTGLGSKVTLQVGAHTVILEEMTDVKVSLFKLGKINEVELWVKAGEIMATTSRTAAVRTEFVVRSPTSTTSIRGTVFTVKVMQNGYTEVIVRDGEVQVKHEITGQEVNLKAGETAKINSIEIKKETNYEAYNSKPPKSNLDEIIARIIQFLKCTLTNKCA